MWDVVFIESQRTSNNTYSCWTEGVSSLPLVTGQTFPKSSFGCHHKSSCRHVVFPSKLVLIFLAWICRADSLQFGELPLRANRIKHSVEETKKFDKVYLGKCKTSAKRFSCKINFLDDWPLRTFLLHIRTLCQGHGVAVWHVSCWQNRRRVQS